MSSVVKEYDCDVGTMIGDLVESSARERGVVCSMDPPVMRTIGFTSYVPLREWKIIERGVDLECSISDAVLGRIRKYLRDQEVADTATGE